MSNWEPPVEVVEKVWLFFLFAWFISWFLVTVCPCGSPIRWGFCDKLDELGGIADTCSFKIKDAR